MKNHLVLLGHRVVELLFEIHPVYLISVIRIEGAGAVLLKVEVVQL